MASRWVARRCCALLAPVGVVVDGIIVECPFDRLLSTVENRFDAMGLPAFPARAAAGVLGRRTAGLLGVFTQSGGLCGGGELSGAADARAAGPACYRSAIARHLRPAGRPKATGHLRGRDISLIWRRSRSCGERRWGGWWESTAMRRGAVFRRPRARSQRTATVALSSVPWWASQASYSMTRGGLACFFIRGIGESARTRVSRRSAVNRRGRISGALAGSDPELLSRPLPVGYNGYSVCRLPAGICSLVKQFMGLAFGWRTMAFIICVENEQGEQLARLPSAHARYALPGGLEMLIPTRVVWCRACGAFRLAEHIPTFAELDKEIQEFPAMWESLPLLSDGLGVHDGSRAGCEEEDY